VTLLKIVGLQVKWKIEKGRARDYNCRAGQGGDSVYFHKIWVVRANNLMLFLAN